MATDLDLILIINNVYASFFLSFFSGAGLIFLGLFCFGGLSFMRGPEFCRAQSFLMVFWFRDQMMMAFSVSSSSPGCHIDDDNEWKY